MVSVLHEGVLELVRGRPEFVADLLRQLLGAEVPAFSEARLTDGTLTEVVPAEYHADAVVLFVEERPVLGAIVEAQLQRDERKRYTWPQYAVGARARHECPFVVIVVTPDPTTARWASEPIEIGGGNLYRPYVVGPQGIPVIVDPDRAAREPELTVLSAIAHGQGEPETAVAVALAAAAAVSPLPDRQRELYSAVIEAALSDAARKALEMLPQTQKFLSESQRHSYERGVAEGEARGKAEGKASALLQILAQRGLAITAEQQQRIAGCTDLGTLDRWLSRVLAVSSVEELLG